MLTIKLNFYLFENCFLCDLSEGMYNLPQAGTARSPTKHTWELFLSLSKYFNNSETHEVTWVSHLTTTPLIIVVYLKRS